MGQRRISTSEELNMVRDMIIMEHMQTILRRSIGDAFNSGNILRRLHAQISQAALNRLEADRRQMRADLKQRQIRILDPESSDLVIYHKIYCRGYEEDFGMTRDVMRSEIAIKLTAYSSELNGLIRSAGK